MDGRGSDPEPETAEPMTLRARSRLGTLLKDKWRLDSLIGVGGMAAVYAATHRNSKRVAVKMLHAELSVDEGIRQRFLREGYVANQVGHRGAVTIDDDDVTEDGAAFLVMELLDGETLESKRLKNGGAMDARAALRAIDQVLATLAAAHEKGIVHRDLKPENLFVLRDGTVKILDFGIARLRERSAAGTATQDGSVMGTPSFMPPEQARGRWSDVDGRTDLWAVGATLYTLLTGRLLHEAETPNEALVRAVTERAPPLANALPGVHPSVAAVVDRALVYEREGRYQSASEMREAVRLAHAALDGAEVLPPLSLPGVSAVSTPSAVVVPVKASTLTTGRGMTLTVPETATPASRGGVSSSTERVPVAALAGGAALLAILVGFGAHVFSPKSAAAPSSNGPIAETAARPVASTDRLVPSPKPEAVAVAVPSAAPVTAPQTIPTAPKTMPTAPKARPVPKAVALSSKPKPVKTAADPFARRH
ncbi:MAG TPA: serine/threonine-protein kinase [Polyangiaceae bacterium]|nr:serine/threonine-protein kinase [Polyangiaceae bacterium]